MTSSAAPRTVSEPLIVFKLGGSLLAGGTLRGRLAEIAGTRNIRPVVVPGGGIFADAVRTAQEEAGFDDALAHRLALAAMGQMAGVMVSLAAGAVRVEDVADIAACHDAGRLPIWDPRALQAGHPDIPETWRVTSDSLAAWLATRLRADRLVLVKSVDAPRNADFRHLADLGVVDAAFPEFAARFPGEIVLCGPASATDGFGVPSSERVPA